MANVAKKATFLASLGAGLEYYDFIIYGMMAGHLSTLFFAGDEPWIALLKAFAVFAVGYLIRPFGGIFFGMIGDAFGRKKTFLSVMLLMAISTFSIGLLPTYGQIGTTASCLLVLLRILQGLSFGAELPGAITVVCEYADKKKHGSYSGFVISSVSVGSLLASLVLYILSQSVALPQMLSWGWRIPFILGGLLAVANYFIRKHLQETPEFSKLQESRPSVSIKAPLIILVRQYRAELMYGIGLTTFVSSLVIFSLYMPTYLVQQFQYVGSDVYLAMTWGMLWSALIMPFCGWLADKIDKTRMFVSTCIAFMLGCFGLFSVLSGGNYSILVLFMVVYQTIIAFLTVCYFPLLTGVFPTPVRYTGLAACYNISYSIMGSAPLVITALIQWTQTANSAIWFLVTFALISALSCLQLAKRKVLSPQINE